MTFKFPKENTPVLLQRQDPKLSPVIGKLEYYQGVPFWINAETGEDIDQDVIAWTYPPGPEQWTSILPQTSGMDS